MRKEYSESNLATPSLQLPDISVRTINNIIADCWTVYQSAKCLCYQMHLRSHIHLKKSQVRLSHWRTSEPTNRRFSVQPDSRQPVHRIAIILFNSGDGAIQDLFRDNTAKLSSLCTSSATPHPKLKPANQIKDLAFLYSRLCANNVYMSQMTVGMSWFVHCSFLLKHKLYTHSVIFFNYKLCTFSELLMVI